MYVWGWGVQVRDEAGVAEWSELMRTVRRSADTQNYLLSLSCITTLDDNVCVWGGYRCVMREV